MGQIRCSVCITEENGKLSIFASIPDKAENTLAGALAGRLMDHATTLMNEALGENQRVEKVSTN
jgi:hypothetical protein